jgi:hypothetical protein
VDWYSIRWVDWASLAGVLLTAVGVLFTWREASRARGAADAARDAVQVTERRLRANQLLLLVPQLRSTASELDRAIDWDDAALARRQFDSWRAIAAHVSGILRNEDVEVEMRRAVQQSVGLASRASSALLEGKRPVGAACSRARTSVAVVCNELTEWVGEHTTRSE